MKETWTNYEKRVAKHISDIKDFGKFLSNHLEEYEELVNGHCDVYKLAKEVFEIESIVNDYENLDGFFQNMTNCGRSADFSYCSPLVDRHKLKISECCTIFNLTEWEDDKVGDKPYQTQLFCYVVQSVNGVEILVHKRNKEFCKKYL